jgi:outer membrane protein TolC
MRTPIIRIFILLAMAVPLVGVNAQTSLDTYVQEGLKNNLVLQQKQIGLEKAMTSLKIANGMFMPTVGLIGNYTSGKGGRSISLPVGDLMNPVYSTLNQLTESNQFPQIQNVEQNFFPHNFYDAKVRTSIPIINTDLVYNKKIQQQQTVLQEFEKEIYTRELIKNIKVAYFNYLGATEAINIFRNAMTRANESKRVNESLLANGKGLYAYILRSESEIENIKSQILDAEKQAENAQLYFNFLLNRNGSEPIFTGFDAEQEIQKVNESTIDASSIQREELKQMRGAVAISETVVKMNKLFWAPRVSGFVDIGSQYQDWKFNSHSRYYLVGVQLDVPLFAGFTNRNKINRASLDRKSAELNYALVDRQLQMNARIVKNSIETSLQNHQSALKQLEAAQSYQRLIEKGYKEGVNTFIETIDARNQLTAAQLNVTINQYRLLSAHANYERETSAYSLPN